MSGFSEPPIKARLVKTIAVWIVVLGVVSVFIGTAIFLFQKSQEKPVVFETASPFYTDITVKTVASGKINPRREIEIKPQVSGVIDKLFVEAGDFVKKGDIVARIQVIPNMQQLNNAESRLEQSRLNLKNATLEYKRQEKLYIEKLVSATEFNQATLQFELHSEAVQTAENNVALIKEGVSKQSGKVANTVLSTISGMILDIPVKEGTFVIETNTFNQGTTIANIANMQDLIFEGYLDESEVGKVEVGMDLRINVGAIPGQSFQAGLEYVSPKASLQNGTIKFEIRAAVDIVQESFLRAGYSANAEIILDEKSSVLAVNEGNLLVEQEMTYVEEHIGEQQFRKVAVVTGISDGINIEILSGLMEGVLIKKRVK